MIELELSALPATPANIAPFGHFVGMEASMPVFAEWPGVKVVGPVPIAVDEGAELLHVQMDASTLPARVMLLERHFKHTQTYLPANGRPFVMVLGTATRDGLPDLDALLAFRFDGSAGIALHAGTWHEFPLALENDTRFTVILRHESHRNDLTDAKYQWDARGPDLERFAIEPRAHVTVRL
jgi:ureidoglycolate lyase